MSEIWRSCNSMMSLSNHVLVWCQQKEGRQYNWMDLRNTRKLDVGLRISCPMMSSRFTSDEMGHNHRPQDLPRSKHILAEGKTLEEDMPFVDR